MSQAIDFAATCEDFRGYLTALAVAHVGPHLRSKLDPADLVQQVMIRAFQGRASFRGEGATQMRAWLRKILTNVIVDGLRKFGGGERVHERSLEAMIDESSVCLEGLLAGRTSSPSHKVGRKEQIVLLAGALAKLPEDQRLAVELRHLREESLEQIAGRMGRSVPAVAGLLRRGIRALRAALDVPSRGS